MPKEEWGTKRTCPETGKRFYDLNKSPVVSPYTGKVVEIETGKHTRTMVADKADKASKTEEKTEDDLTEGDDLVEDDADGDEEEVDLEDDVLEDDEDADVSLDEIKDVAAPEED